MKAPAIPAIIDHDQGTITFSLSFTVNPEWSTDSCLASELAGELRRFLVDLVQRRETIDLAALVTYDPYWDRTIIDVA